MSGQGLETRKSAAGEGGAARSPSAHAAGAGPVIDVKDLSLTFMTDDGPVHALADIDLNVERGEFVSLIGPSGCGKTTLLRVIADLEQPSAGSILVNGLSPEKARETRCYGYVFQAPALYPWRSIARNVALAARSDGRAQRRSARRASGATSISSISPASNGNSRGSFPAACSSAPPSPARSPSIRRCS